MGKIPVQCTACQATFDALLSFAGQIRPCPHCKTPLQIPIPATSPAAKTTDHSGIQVSPVPLISEPPSADAERLVTLSTFFRPLVAILSIICVSLVLVLVFVPAPQREQLAQDKTAPAEQPKVAIEPPAPQPPVVDKQPAAEVAPPPEKIKQPAKVDPLEKDLLALPMEQGPAVPIIADPPEAKPEPVLPAANPFAPPVQNIARRGRNVLLNPPPMYGTQFQWNQLPGDEEDYLLARHLSFTPHQRKLSFSLEQFETPKDAYEPWKNHHSMAMWNLQINAAQQAMELASRSGDFGQLANDLAMLRTIRVHLGWMLAIHLTDDRYDERKESNTDFFKKRRVLFRAWEAYLLSWKKLVEKFEKELRTAAITPLHNPEDLVFMDLLFNPPPPPPDDNFRQFSLFPRMLYHRYPAVENAQAYFQAERQARRLWNPELLCHLADLHWLAEPNRAGLVNLRYHQRHGRIVSGLRIGIIVHHEDTGKSLRQLFSIAESEIKKRHSSTKFTPAHANHTNRELSELLVGVPYKQLVAELHARMILGQFGPAYADLHPWDQQNIGQMAIFSVNLFDALKKAWLGYWDYAIIIKKSPATADVEIKFVDLIALDELGKVVIRNPPTDIKTQTEAYRKSLIELLKLVDAHVALQPIEKLLPEDLQLRQKFQQDSFLRESYTSIILEKTYREKFLKQKFPLASDADNSTRQSQYNLYFKPSAPMDVPLRTCYLTMGILDDAFYQSGTREKPYSFPYNKD